MEIISVQNLSKKFGKFEAVKNLTIKIKILTNNILKYNYYNRQRCAQ